MSVFYADKPVVGRLVQLYNEVHGTNCTDLRECEELTLTIFERNGRLPSMVADDLINQLEQQLDKEKS